MKTGLFEKGKTYCTWTRAGELRLFKATNVLRRKSTGERVFVVGSFNGKVEQRYEIRRAKDGTEYIIPDSRYSLVVTAEEYK
ncbi:MAG: hypothetical protein J6R68_04135 [Clostridia bacterium]|nr:hypothetical protein [Clostridia bacterium]MBO7289556.1 hypothetical protein [Clostridia bacterium]